MAFKDNDPCRDNADVDEPIFTLRAQDKTAPIAVRLWANVARLMGAPPEKWLKAEEVAFEMECWQNDHSDRVKVPD